MSEQIMINAVSRSELGSNRARNIRSDNMVPAVIYGNEKELLNVNIPLNELTKASQNDLFFTQVLIINCLLYTSPSPRDREKSRMPSSA